MTMSMLEPLLAQPLVYRLWRAPFVRQKLRPFLAHNEIGQLGCVLEVGCGPGTNARLFAPAQYLGLDWNDAYIQYAKRRHRGRFVGRSKRGRGSPSIAFWSTASSTISSPRTFAGSWQTSAASLRKAERSTFSSLFYQQS
jgi:SAM-dependent methyltransferase